MCPPKIFVKQTQVWVPRISVSDKLFWFHRKKKNKLTCPAIACDTYLKGQVELYQNKEDNRSNADRKNKETPQKLSTIKAALLLPGRGCKGIVPFSCPFSVPG